MQKAVAAAAAIVATVRQQLAVNSRRKRLALRQLQQHQQQQLHLNVKQYLFLMQNVSQRSTVQPAITVVAVTVMVLVIV
jgi:Ni,Fe-hydrogenase I cytochrome b subunit